MADSSSSSFSISRASLKDVRRLAEIATRAFDNDANTQVKAMARPPNAFADSMDRVMRMWMSSGPRWAVLKATDDSTGEIVGWICWGCSRGVGELDPGPSHEATTGNGGSDDDETRGESSQASGTRDTGEMLPPSGPNSGRIDELEKLTGGHLAAFQKKIMPDGTDCMYIISVLVDPRFHGRGIGSRLVLWGTAQADRHGVFCWVHSSEAGWKLFQKQGFKEEDRLTVDLDEYAVGPPENGDSKWGEYTFRYMVRQPVVLSR